jgi:hypothetical protein
MRTFVGKVVMKKIASGSKSEHVAVILKTASSEYVLRTAYGNPFHNPRLERLIGKTIRCKGEVTDYALIVTEFAEIKSARTRKYLRGMVRK